MVVAQTCALTKREVTIANALQVTSCNRTPKLAKVRFDYVFKITPYKRFYL